MRIAIPFALLAVVATAGCSMPSFGVPRFLEPYRMEVQQGNYIPQEAALQLKPGMTKDQVRFLLGTPLLNDVFHQDRWDYVFRRQRANATEIEEQRLTLLFKDDRLVQMIGDAAPEIVSEDAPPAGASRPR
ncbi:MAG: outer membrane protein assembly factor BamE [Burkholderiales bacterium]|jgi:outer membrane protein assembly factor BamE|nr:outer membrane protein assembly factor BamE [Burkholderiales bacterium]